MEEWLARKVVNLRIFRDDEGRMNRSLLDTGGEALVVIQFTLAAETRASDRKVGTGFGQIRCSTKGKPPLRTTVTVTVRNRQ